MRMRPPGSLGGGCENYGNYELYSMGWHRECRGTLAWCPPSLPWVPPVLRCTSCRNRRDFLLQKYHLNAGRAQKCGAACPDHFIGTFLGGYPLEPSMWGFMGEKSKQKGIFISLRSQSCPEIAHCPDGAGSWGCIVRSRCYWEGLGHQGLLPHPRGRTEALPLHPL